ncbi:MAG: hypothetical protein ABI859_07120 [Pseudomonadota bacterium]
MRSSLTPMLLLAVSALGGCSGGDKPPPQQVIAEPAMQALEKARTVEATVEQHKADIDAAVDTQGQ